MHGAVDRQSGEDTERDRQMACNSSDSKRLVGKVVIITGGASGIGEVAVRLFVEHGAKVVIADIQDDKGTQLVSELGPDNAVYKHCDVSKEEDMEALVSSTLALWGKLDVMYNNAGIVGSTIFEDVVGLDMDDFDRVLSVNLRGNALGVKHAARAMVAAGTKGVILCTASVSSIMGGMAPVAYTASQHAVLGLVRAASSALGKHGVRVNCLSAWSVATPLLVNHLRAGMKDDTMTAEQCEQLRDLQANLHGHSLSALDVARSALYLASEESAFVSGLNLIIDGGFSATSHAFDS